MTDDIWTRAEPDSPCTKICTIHPRARICIGCFRTLDEIATWSSLDREQRLSLMATLPDREKLLRLRNGGSKSRRKSA